MEINHKNEVIDKIDLKRKLISEKLAEIKEDKKELEEERQHLNALAGRLKRDSVTAADLIFMKRIFTSANRKILW